MRAVFIAGTDTDIGKTVVSGLTAKYFKEKGHKAITQKWIQTGSTKLPADIKTHLDIMGMKKEDVSQWLEDMCPYKFKFPASPHLSSGMERKKISIDKIKKSFSRLCDNFDFVIVEGTGGIMVPINSKKLIIDVAQDLRLPVILVVGNKLGAINHALLTLEVLDSRGFNTIGIIYNNNTGNQNKKILDDNIKIISKLSGKKNLGVIPFSKKANLTDICFDVIGRNVYNAVGHNS